MENVTLVIDQNDNYSIMSQSQQPNIADILIVLDNSINK